MGNAVAQATYSEAVPARPKTLVQLGFHWRGIIVAEGQHS